MSIDPTRMDQQAYTALERLNEESVRVQSKGWFFNTEEEYPAQPAEDGTIAIPPSWTRVRLNAKSAYRYRVTVRDGKLYDKSTRSFVFDDTVYLDFVEVHQFANVPAPVRYYIICRAGRIFGPSRLPESNTYRFTKEEEDLAYSEALQADNEDEGNNLPEASPHFSNMRRR